MEIGSFIEMQFNKGKEYYCNDEYDIACLNSGRTAIYHAFRLTECNAIWLPYYQCETVRDFLKRKKVSIKYYHIDFDFNPTDLLPEKNEAVLFVNYFGIMSNERMKNLASCYSNAIIDNSQGFFCCPVEECYNIYSARKFFGVPDGAYVIGKNSGKFVDSYEQCYSSDTSLFLLQRIEYGCEGRAYESRTANEQRIDTEDIMKMSELTKRILMGTDYDLVFEIRRKNFETARSMFDKINRLDVAMYYDRETVPMVYPLVIEDDSLLSRLQNAKHFQGHWWGYLLNEMSEDGFERYLSRFMVPLTIDQRYGEEELRYIKNVISDL